MDDNYILQLYKGGDRQQAFNLIVRKYSERLYWHIRRMVVNHEDADDCLQNTFLRIWNALETFREDSALYTWLYRIATNETISFLRKERIRKAFSFDQMADRISGTLADDPYFNGDRLQAVLHKAVAKLPPKQKAVFCLRYFDELKYEDISEILKSTVGSLKASYHHAYNKVANWVKEEVVSD